MMIATPNERFFAAFPVNCGGCSSGVVPVPVCVIVLLGLKIDVKVVPPRCSDKDPFTCVGCGIPGGRFTLGLGVALLPLKVTVISVMDKTGEV